MPSFLPPHRVLASVSGKHTVKLWDLADTDRPRSVLTGHNDTIQSLTFNLTGTLMVATCRDKKTAYSTLVQESKLFASL
jgi:WD40 repeat protein